MTVYYGMMEMQGDGSPGDPRRLSEWQGFRVDFHCRLIRAELACIAASGGSNADIQAIFDNNPWSLVADCSHSFGVYSMTLPDSYADALAANLMHPSEPQPVGSVLATDPSLLKQMCHAHAVGVVAHLNQANLGFTIGNTTPLQDVRTAINGFTTASLGAASTAIRNRYLARLAATAADGFPAAFMTSGTWNITNMVAYANLLDGLPMSDPRNLIHILYGLAANMVISVSTAF